MHTKQSDESMTRYSVTMHKSLWQRAKEKAGIVPMAALVRKLLEMYLADEIDINSKGESI